MEPPRRTIRRRHTFGDRPKSQPSLSKRDQKNLAPAAKDWREAAYSLGILKTGYLETASEQWDRSAAATSSVKKTRFVVLTHAQLSWFKRNPGDTEYGDERGAIPLDQVTSVKLDGEKIEVFDQGGLRRWFLCRDGKAKAWRDAIDVARQARCRSPAASSPREAPSAPSTVYVLPVPAVPRNGGQIQDALAQSRLRQGQIQGISPTMVGVVCHPVPEGGTALRGTAP